MENRMKTECGKEVHLVGIGVCGQPIVQIKTGKGSKKEHTAWRLARVIRGNIAIQFGSGQKYKLKRKIIELEIYSLNYLASGLQSNSYNEVEFLTNGVVKLER